MDICKFDPATLNVYVKVSAHKVKVNVKLIVSFWKDSLKRLERDRYIRQNK